MISSKGRPSLASCIAIVLALAGSVVACASHSEGTPGAEGPPRLRPLAASGAPTTPVVAAPRVAVLANEPPREGFVPAPSPAVPPAERAPALPEPANAACPSEMALVDGQYCTEVAQTCVDWMEPPTAGGTVGRCRRFAPSTCTGQRVHQRFCIDKDEYTAPGETLPKGSSSWTDAKNTCEAEGKRLRKESEWNFACEGEEMLPYPIGLERDSTKCNYDQMHLYDPFGKLADLRKPSSEVAACVSPFGVRSLTGNVDEWVYRDVTWGAWRSAMKGGWWMAARNRCRPATTAHDEHYTDLQAGFRCCSDPS